MDHGETRNTLASFLLTLCPGPLYGPAPLSPMADHRAVKRIYDTPEIHYYTTHILHHSGLFDIYIYIYIAD